MEKNFDSQRGFFTRRILLASGLVSLGLFLGIFCLSAARPDEARAYSSTDRSSATLGKEKITSPLGGSMFTSQQPSGFETRPLAPSAQNEWSIVNSANASATHSNGLQAVTCLSSSDCWAVGDYYNGSVYQTLIEHWDGTSWTIVASPNTSTTQLNFLTSVTCVSASQCWAAGYYSTSFAATSIPQTLIERWDGISWTIVSSPNSTPSATACVVNGFLPGCTQDNLLYGLSCLSASDCWAVGYFRNLNSGNNGQTLTEHWDGTSWAIVSSPNTSATQLNFLFGMTCASASECWAVGYYNPGGSPNQTLVERWDGISWAIVSSPNTSSSQFNQLQAITCGPASSCWAVGTHQISGGYQTLIEQWNGTSWAIVSSPNSSSSHLNQLFGVTCVSASECWAVGSSGQALIERWDGTSWSIVPSPNTLTTQSNSMVNVTCTSAVDCWGVGYYFVSGGFTQTLTEHYGAVSPLSPTSVVSRKTHGPAGSFDVDLPRTGTPGIECRTGGPSNDYQVIITFANAVTFNTAAVTSGTGSVSTTSGGGTPAITANLTGVTNAETITLTLSGVNDGTNRSDIAIAMSVLTGDTTADGFVNSGDIAQTKSQSGVAVTNSNFRQDGNIDGSIDSGDISLVKSKSGTALPQ